MAGLWIRWDCAAADNELWNELGERLGVPPAQALGHYLLMVSRLVRRRHDGNITGLPSSVLETWADWTGETGLFSTTVLLLCQDENGELRGFRKRNAKLIAKQLSDREKRRNPQPTPDKPPENPRETLGYTKTKTIDVNGSSSSSSGQPVDAIRYAQVCTAAANRGLGESLGPAFHGLVSANQSGIVADWITAGIPVEAVARAIYERAKTYKATATRRQPTGLQYFRQVVQEAWDREQGRGIATPAPRQKPESTPSSPALRKYKPPPVPVRHGGTEAFGDILAREMGKYSKPEDAA